MSELEQRLFMAMIDAFELAGVYLGHRLGYFQALTGLGNASAGELAAAAGTNPRYTREWLEQMAAGGLIAVWEQSDNSDARRYALIPGTEGVLTDTDGSNALIHNVRAVISALAAAPELVDHYRNGTGMSFAEFGVDMREGQALANRRGFLDDLATEWMPALGDVHARLRDEPGGRIADIGFGAGWSSIALARAYPDATVDGLDLDAASVALAQANADDAGVGDRVQFKVQDAANPELVGQYDLVCSFECVHDLAEPVVVLRAMRDLLGEHGAVLIGDIAAPEDFNSPGDLFDRISYGFSVFHCLPVGMDGENAVGTGTVMRESTLRSYAAAAGFGSVTVLPIEHPMWRFYRLNK